MTIPAKSPRAAQYLRMSTDHQRYSLEQQTTQIALFAVEHGIEIVRTYSDAGRSGLTLTGRAGLQELLADVLSPQRDFDLVLVLDVSRWGRFQNPDQAAHYEFICREAGVPIRYCAETFADDTSLPSVIMKHLKRVMAAEYSRELAAKVKAAQSRQAAAGYKMGGPAPLGFRRVVVDREGNVRGEPGRGERKGFQGDRVVLLPGPESERRLVRRIYRMYVAGVTSDAIADRLNAEGVEAPRGPSWNGHIIRRVLRHESNIGIYVYGKRSRPFRGRSVDNPPEKWIQAKVLEPIISRATFERAAAIMRDRTGQSWSRDAVVRGLRALVEREGQLNETLINADPNLPGSAYIKTRIGSLKSLRRELGMANLPARHFTEEELLEKLRAAHARHGPLTTKILQSDPTLPSRMSIARRFGGFIPMYRRMGVPYDPGKRWYGGNRPTNEKHP